MQHIENFDMARIEVRESIPFSGQLGQYTVLVVGYPTTSQGLMLKIGHPLKLLTVKISLYHYGKNL